MGVVKHVFITVTTLLQSFGMVFSGSLSIRFFIVGWGRSVTLLPAAARPPMLGAGFVGERFLQLPNESSARLSSRLGAVTPGWVPGLESLADRSDRKTRVAVSDSIAVSAPSMCCSTLSSHLLMSPLCASPYLLFFSDQHYPTPVNAVLRLRSVSQLVSCLI